MAGRAKENILGGSLKYLFVYLKSVCLNDLNVVTLFIHLYIYIFIYIYIYPYLYIYISLYNPYTSSCLLVSMVGFNSIYSCATGGPPPIDHWSPVLLGSRLVLGHRWVLWSFELSGRVAWRSLDGAGKREREDLIWFESENQME